MNILVLQDDAVLVGCNKILVKDSDSEEVCSGRALKACAHFNKPIEHFSSIFLGYLMAFDWIPTGGFSNLFLVLTIK
jgi:hypothetical protein